MCYQNALFFSFWLDFLFYRRDKFNLGGSAIWLCTSNFNMMLEVLENFTDGFNDAGDTFYTNETIVNPGFRFVINIRKLQIVPGLSVPFSFKDKQTTFSAFLYLSFEHPY